MGANAITIPNVCFGLLMNIIIQCLKNYLKKKQQHFGIFREENMRMR